MEEKEKKILKLRLGLAIVKVLKENYVKAKSNKIEGIKDHKLVSSLRKLAAASGIDYGSIQKISTGDISPEFVTVVTIIDALDKTLLLFSKYYDSLSTKEVIAYQASIEKARKERKKEIKKDSKGGKK